MRKALLAIGAAATWVAAAASQTPQMPTPGAEQKNLSYFEGTWKVEAAMHPSPFGPGGSMTATESCRKFQGGWHLVCDSDGTSPMGPIKSHTLMTFDSAAKQYRYFSVSNLPEAEMATGSFTDNTWKWTTDVTIEGKKMQSRFLMNEVSPSLYTMKWEVSTDGNSWQTVVEGKATKTSP